MLLGSSGEAAAAKVRSVQPGDAEKKPDYCKMARSEATQHRHGQQDQNHRARTIYGWA